MLIFFESHHIGRGQNCAVLSSCLEEEVVAVIAAGEHVCSSLKRNRGGFKCHSVIFLFPVCFAATGFRPSDASLATSTPVYDLQSKHYLLAVFKQDSEDMILPRAQVIKSMQLCSFQSTPILLLT